MSATATAMQRISRSSLGATNDPDTQLAPATLPDDALIESARRGEDGAFDVLIDRYQRLCLAKAYSILGNRADAEDEVQTAWVQAWERLMWTYQRALPWARPGEKWVLMERIYEGPGRS